MNPQEMLAQLGLEGKEIAIYMGLLELGEATVLSISMKTGVKRPTSYLILESLEKRGLVSRMIRGKKISFTPQHPKKILTDAEIRVKQLKEIMPQFEAVMQRADDRPRIMIYEGKEALDRAYDDAFLHKGEIVFMSNMKLVQEVFARSLNKLDYALGHGLSSREVLDESPESREYAQRVQRPYRQVQFMPKEFSPFATDIGIFGKTTLITSGKKEYFTVKIESKEIADAFRAMFEAMWKISGDSAEPSETKD